MKFEAFGTTWLVSFWPGLGWQLGSNHEYWRRWVIGPFYVLRWHNDDNAEAES